MTPHDRPDLVTLDDRTISIGVLANLSSSFLAGVGLAHEETLLRHMRERFRTDLGSRLGHTPSDQECHAALDAQIHRLRLSIGEDV